jgi:hypothetical protein
VIYIVRINVYTYDRSRIVNAGAFGALARASARADNVELGRKEGTILQAQVTMKYIA